jgi:iron(II)-dependent oxidoreductase
VRVAQRNGTDANTKMNWMGFRCARDANEGAGAQPAEAK